MAARVTLLAMLLVAAQCFFHASHPAVFRTVFIPRVTLADIVDKIDISQAPVKDAGPTPFEKELAMTPAALMNRWNPLIAEASKKFDVPMAWIRAVLHRESAGRTLTAEGVAITSGAGAMGIMQVMPGTYEQMRAQYGLGADPYNPHDNMIAGTAYLSWLKRRYGFPAMFAAYNDGPGNFDRYLQQGGTLPAETEAYVSEITENLRTRKTKTAA